MTRAEIADRIMTWLDAGGPGHRTYRTLEIAVGESKSARVTIDLHVSWIDSRDRLNSRHYASEGRTVGAALRRVQVPTPKGKR
jgi:hypothetical protein